MKIRSMLAAFALSTFLVQPIFAAGDYAMLAEAVSKLIENSNQQSKDIEDFRTKLGTLDDFNKKRDQDKNLLERMDSDITKLLAMQNQIDRLNNDNKMHGEDINKLIRDMHDAQVKIQNLESAQGNDESRRLSDKAARIDKQSFDLQGIVVKRNLDQTGDVGSPAQIEKTAAPVMQNQSNINQSSKTQVQRKQSNQLEIDMLKQ